MCMGAIETRIQWHVLGTEGCVHVKGTECFHLILYSYQNCSHAHFLSNHQWSKSWFQDPDSARLWKLVKQNMVVLWWEESGSVGFKTFDIKGDSIQHSFCNSKIQELDKFERYFYSWNSKQCENLMYLFEHLRHWEIPSSSPGLIG